MVSTHKFDKAKFKKQNPELYNCYLTSKVAKGKAGYVLITPPAKDKEEG